MRDPVGEPTLRALRLWSLVQREHKEEHYLKAFSRAVYTEGVDAGSDRGMRMIVERAGIAWAKAKPLLDGGSQAHAGSEAWRQMVDAHEYELQALGLWGVPSFAYGPRVALWGADRLRVLEDAIAVDAATQ
jgi:2-hydroxychromene-2-carboxylate isomerase